MFWEAIILLWTIIDFVRYIYYCRTYRELNKPVKKSIGKNNGVNNFLNDIRKYPEMFMENLDDIFYHKVKPEDMNYTDVCDALYFLVNKTGLPSNSKLHIMYVPRSLKANTSKRFLKYTMDPGVMYCSVTDITL